MKPRNAGSQHAVPTAASDGPPQACSGTSAGALLAEDASRDSWPAADECSDGGRKGSGAGVTLQQELTLHDWTSDAESEVRSGPSPRPGCSHSHAHLARTVWGTLQQDVGSQRKSAPFWALQSKACRPLQMETDAAEACPPEDVELSLQDWQRPGSQPPAEPPPRWGAPGCCLESMQHAPQPESGSFWRFPYANPANGPGGMQWILC